MQTSTSTINHMITIKTPIIVPILMPDEFYPGYYKRLITANGISDDKLGNEALNETVNQLNPHLSYSHYIFKVASLLNMTPENLIRCHTLIPILGRINTTPIDINCHQIFLNRLVKQSLCFCKECVDEDVNYWGFSYWRRSHQLPGIDWCSKHNTPLCMIKEMNSFYQPPKNHTQLNKYQISATEIYERRKNINIKRFNELLQDYCDAQSHLDHKSVSQLLRKQAIKLDFHYIFRSTSKKILTDIIFNDFPEAWINKHFPSLKDMNISQLHEIFFPNSNPKILNTFLAAVILFPGVDNILSYLVKHEFAPTISKIPNSELIQAYIHCRGNISNAARLLGLQQSNLTEKLSRIGCPSLNNISPTTLIALQKFYIGDSLPNILKMKNLNFDEFSSILRSGSVNVNFALNEYY